jgi:hypothetical protein
MLELIALILIIGFFMGLWVVPVGNLVYVLLVVALILIIVKISKGGPWYSL